MLQGGLPVITDSHPYKSNEIFLRNRFYSEKSDNEPTRPGMPRSVALAYQNGESGK